MLLEAPTADEHIGKKKLAKLQAKAEKKAQREAVNICSFKDLNS